MTVHKLHTGDGYVYLTRQVASSDVVRARGVGLTDYYAASGNPPGRWVGSGAELLGLSGDVKAEQMRLLYGECRHPGTGDQLGQSPAVYPLPAEDEFDHRLKAAWAQFKDDHKRLPEPGIESDFVKFMVAREYLMENPREIPDVAKAFRAIKRLQLDGERQGVEMPIPPQLTVEAELRAPREGEVQKYLAWRRSRQRHAVSGYDCVFTPPKSVSVLWGLAPRKVSRVIEEAHQAAWQSALQFIEENACYTRIGGDGVRLVDGDGLVCSAFDHTDSRCGDPNLHTHMVIANRVHTNAVRGGTARPIGDEWRSLDARLLYQVTVAASERYNLLIEHEVSARLGVEFEDRFTTREGEPVREITGIPLDLCESFSARRSAIEPAAAKLIEEWTRKNGVAPSVATQTRLFQQATLDTRPMKEEGVTLLDRRRQWRKRAAAFFQGVSHLDVSIENLLSRTPRPRTRLSDEDVDALAAAAFDVLDHKHNAFTRGRMNAVAVRTIRSVLSKSTEARMKSRLDHRLLMAPRIDDVELEDAASRVVSRLIDSYVWEGRAPEVVTAPTSLRRIDGSSQYQDASQFWYFSRRAQARDGILLKAATEQAGPVFSASDVAVLAPGLTPSQLDVASRFARSGKRLDFAIGPAGSGKTTAMKAFCRTVDINGGRVIALAPSAIAAAVLGHEVGADGETVAKFLHVHGRYGAPKGHVPPELRIDRNTILLVDEAAMTATKDLAAIVELAEEVGASVRLIGDPAQLGAIGGGGALRLLHNKIGGSVLEEIHRFVDPQERDATLRLRGGRFDAVDFYISANRVHGGIHGVLLDDVYRAWEADSDSGTSVMVSMSNADVVALNRRAQEHRIASGDVSMTSIRLHEGTSLGVGDRVVTRSNNRRVRRDSGEWVRNGDVWVVESIGSDGKTVVKHIQDGGSAILPGSYVRRDLELAYAATIHRVQGMTVDTSHTLVTPSMTREQLYVAATRGRRDNRFYVVSDPSLTDDPHTPPEQSQSPAQVLRTVISREGAERSVTELLEAEQMRTSSAGFLLDIYHDVLSEFSPPVDHGYVREVLENTLGQAAEFLVDDVDAWGHVAERVTALKATGVDVEARIRDRVSITNLLESDDVADYISLTLGEAGPGRHVENEEIDNYLGRLEVAIRERLTHPQGHENLPRGERDIARLRRAWQITETTVPVEREDVFDTALLPIEADGLGFEDLHEIDQTPPTTPTGPSIGL